MTLITNVRGLAGFHLPVHVGAAYSDSAGGTCSPGGTCSIFVIDLTTPAIARSAPLPVT